MTLGALILALCALLGVDSGITEDSPLWDCRTMGNHQCGPDSHNRILGYH